MNEFTAKKLGEVLAFADTSLDTANRAEKALEVAFGIEGLNKIRNQNQQHIDTINQIAKDNNITEIVQKKLEGTGQKLKSMRDLYIGNEWENPTELLEWSGFFEGAAIVHWDLVMGVADSLELADLKILANEALSLHRELFATTENKLREYGASKSK